MEHKVELIVLSRPLVVRTAIVVLALAITITAPPIGALAAPTLDQQQPTIDTTVGGLAIGHTSNQILGQTITAGATGDLVRVDLPVACDGTGDLIIQIRDLAATGAPGGTIKSTTTIAGSTLPSFPTGGVTFRAFTLAVPVAVTPGARYAIVLSSNGTTVNDGCGIFRGPVGDSYSGGDLYVDALPSAPGWVRVCDVPNERCDLPFKTWVEPAAAATATIVFIGSSQGAAFDTMAPDGSNRTAIAGSLGERPRWSPTRDRMSFFDSVAGDKELFVANADGTGRVQLTSRPGPDQDGSWSPAGDRIAYTRLDTSTGRTDVWVLDSRTGAGATNLTNEAAGSFAQAPAWSPDATKIAFVSSRATGSFQVFVMNADGTGQVRIVTDPDTDLFPAWSFDGTKIAYERCVMVCQIYVTDANGTGTPTQLTTAGSNESPTWSPDGTKIAFASDRSGSSRIYTMDANGANQTAITTSFGAEPDWGRTVNETVSASVASGGTLSTGSTATPAEQMQVSVTTPNAGNVSIAIAPQPPGPAPAGYTFLGLQVKISAPAATAGTPLVIVFTIDASLVPPGGAASIQPQRNSVLVGPCSGSTTATPDPCFSVSTLPGGDVQLTVRTSQASLWTFVVPVNPPPSCTDARATPDTLWPPDGTLRLVRVGGISDPDGDVVTVRVDRVIQDEPVLGAGSSQTSPDAERTARADEVLLRAERSGSGDGRVYTIAFTAHDGRGGSCSGTVAVGVPHARSRQAVLTPGVGFDSFAPR